MARLTAALDQVQLAADVRRTVPLSLRLVRLGGEEIIPALAGVARPGFKTWDSGVSGCPADWVLFSNVQVLKGLGAVNPTTSRAWTSLASP